jgi:hypothetical protein
MPLGGIYGHRPVVGGNPVKCKLSWVVLEKRGHALFEQPAATSTSLIILVILARTVGGPTACLSRNSGWVLLDAYPCTYLLPNAGVRGVKFIGRSCYLRTNKPIGEYLEANPEVLIRYRWSRSSAQAHVPAEGATLR